MTDGEKQHKHEFERCIEEVMAQGHEKGNAFAICTATFQRAGKPIFVGEVVSPRCYYMIGELKHDFTQLGINRVYGQAIHPMKTYHPNEFPEVRVYLEEELQKAAETLIRKPFGMDHLYLLPEPNHITKAWYADGAVNFEGIVDNNIKKMIESGEIKGVSVEIDWIKPGGALEYVNGVAPRNFELSSVHFLKSFQPGDPRAFVKVMEGIIARLKKAEKPTQLNPQGLETKTKMKIEEQEIKNMVEAIVKKVLTEQEDEREKLRQAQQERAQKYGIEPKEGGNLTKPSEYKDVPVDQFADPVNYRYPIVKDHVRAALAYFNQPANRQAGGYTHEEAVKMMTKIIKAALANDIDVSYQSDDPVYRDLPDELKTKLAGYQKEGKTLTEQAEEEPERRKRQPKTDRERLIDHFSEETALKLFDLIGEEAYKLLLERGNKLQEQAAEEEELECPESQRWDPEKQACVSIEGKRKRALAETVVQPGPGEPMIPVKEVVRMIEAVIPPKGVERSWTFGAQRFSQEVKGVVHQLKGRLEKHE